MVKKLTEETKRKISSSMKGKNRYIKTQEHRDKISKTLSGRKLSKERKQKNRDWCKSDIGQKILRQNAINTLNKLKKSKISKAELILVEYFKRNHIEFISQWKYKLGLADFYLPQFNIVLFCDGLYWHSLKGYKERDEKQTNYLQNEGYTVLRLTSENITKNEEVFLYAN